MFSYAEFEDPLYDAVPNSEWNFNSLESDPYHKLDDTTRGVSMCQRSVDQFCFSGMSDKLGSSLDNNPIFFSGEDYERLLPGECSETVQLFFTPFSSASLHNNVSRSVMSEPFADCTGFLEHHLPPRPPSSQHFTFQPSTLFVEGCSPQLIGNSLVTFLTSEVVASVTKVRPQKYSIKAEVFVEGVACTMKLRVYSHDRKYAVEVQRRAGDAFVLQSTFGLLKAFLKVHCGGVSGQGDAPAPLGQPALPMSEQFEEHQEVDSAEVIAPLLMMATVAGLQAEAASALAAMVRGGRISAAPLLAAPDDVASALTGLLASGCLTTVYPAARCVSDLAALGEADSILAHHGLLQTMALQAVAELRTSQGLVGTALAKAVVDTLQCCAGSLTSTVAKELHKVLDDALHDEVLKTNGVACRHLEQALLNTWLCIQLGITAIRV